MHNTIELIVAKATPKAVERSKAHSARSYKIFQELASEPHVGRMCRMKVDVSTRGYRSRKHEQRTVSAVEFNVNGESIRVPVKGLEIVSEL